MERSLAAAPFVLSVPNAANLVAITVVAEPPLPWVQGNLKWHGKPLTRWFTAMLLEKAHPTHAGPESSPN
jgi:hypothetical protein